MRLLVVGDPHAHPDYDNDRFTWLGEYIVSTRPDKVLCLGDWRDLASLCRHSSKLSLDGQRTALELQHSADAECRMFQPYKEWLKRSKKAKKTEFVLLLGNHDVRLSMLADSHPVLEGLVDAPWHKMWDEIVPFKEVYPVAPGIIASHYFVSGAMERAIGTPNLARKLVQKNHMSTIVGHSHVLDYHEEPDGNGRTIWGLSPGYYGHLDYDEGWCKQSKKAWWRGVVMLTLDDTGRLLKKEYVTMEHMRLEYGTL